MEAAEDSSASEREKVLEDLIDRLSSSAEHEAVAQEIGALRSIYAEENGETIWPQDGDPPSGFLVRYEVHMNLQPPHDTEYTRFGVLVSIPDGYPTFSAPQLQLMSKYIGSFRVDSILFGAILRTFISTIDSVEWNGDVCVFDGLENVRDRVTKWYVERLGETTARGILKREEKATHDASLQEDVPLSGAALGGSIVQQPLDGVEFSVSEPIVDRKSIFIGRACKLSSPNQVPLILELLMADKRLARAAHPIINAWRCKIDGTLYQDNDDDGETAAGGRLAHLLQILEVDNVLIVVTRYFGGVHLGPDRFKHINQAARNALEVGGFLFHAESEKGAKSKKRGK